MDAREKLNVFAELRGWDKNKLIGWSEAADFGEWLVKNCSIPAVVGQSGQLICDSELLSCYHCKGTGKIHYDNGTWQVCYTCGGSGTR